MSRTVPPHAREAGFTLTEMVAGLLVAAMLISGLAEVTRQFARASVHVRDDLASTRGVRAAEAAFLAIERVGPQDLLVTDTRLIVDASSEDPIVFELRVGANGARTLVWADGARTARLSATARFDQDAGGVVRLWDAPDAPPLLVARPRREAPLDCRYDVVGRRCR